MFSPYLGKVYSIIDVNSTLERYQDKINFFICDDVYMQAAAAIAEGKIIGWFQGRSECGPRALGNRSILADPRDPKMKDYLNSRVKFREAFRPFAPSILWEYQTEYFDLDIPSPYMLMIADIFPEKRKLIPAVTHIDGTGRLQTCIKEMNPVYYKLIESFHHITGIPVVLDTSFNIKGEPIVETPEDAIKCFIGTGIDELYLDNFFITKKKILPDTK